MSIQAQLGAVPPELRLKPGEAMPFRGQGPVVEGKLSVGEAQAAACRKNRRPAEQYASVGDYDPVLRAQCRLDQEG